MLFLRQEGQNFLLGGTNSLIRNPVNQIRDTQFLAPFLEPFLELFLEHRRHPHEPQEATVSTDELALADIVLAVPHEARGHLATADCACQGGELHTARRHLVVLAVDGHDAVAGGKDRRHALTAAAGGHGIVNQAVEIVARHRLTGGLEDEIIDPFPVAVLLIQGLTLLDGLVGTGGIDFVGGLTVHPIVGAAEPGTLGAHHTHMVGGEGLAQGAGVVDIRGLVSHALDAGVTSTIDCPGLLGDLLDLFLISVDLHLAFVENGAKVLMVFGLACSNLPMCSRVKPFSTAALPIRYQAISRWPMCMTP